MCPRSGDQIQTDNTEAFARAVQTGVRHIMHNPEASFYAYAKEGELSSSNGSISTHFMLVAMRGGYGNDLLPVHMKALEAIFTDDSIGLAHHKRLPPVGDAFERDVVVYKIEPCR